MSSNTARAFSSCLVTTASVAARAFVGPAAAPVAVALEGCCGGLEGAWEGQEEGLEEGLEDGTSRFRNLFI
jgi:hypothetical protein